MKKDEENVGVGDKASNFVADVAAEARKTTWPHREELVQSTVVVIVTIVLLAAFVYVSDTVLGFCVNAITKAAAG